MSIQLAPISNAPRSAGEPPLARASKPVMPRVLQSARAPAQLSFFFKRA